MVEGKLNDEAQRVMNLANREARRYHSYSIGPDHICLGILGEKNAATLLLDQMEVDVKALENKVRESIRPGKNECPDDRRLPQTPHALLVLEWADLLAHRRDIGATHLLYGILKVEESSACYALREQGVTDRKYRRRLQDMEDGR